MAAPNRAQLARLLQKAMGCCPTEQQIDNALRGYEDAERENAILEASGLSRSESLAAAEASIAEALRILHPDLSDEEFTHLFAESTEAAKLGGMDAAAKVLGRFRKAKRVL